MEKKRGYKHGGCWTTEYIAWTNMKARCDNPNLPQFKDWGGRGITYCDRWKTFPPFLADMGLRPKGMVLDRIDNGKGYSKANCRWTTRKASLENRRPYTVSVENRTRDKRGRFI